MTMFFISVCRALDFKSTIYIPWDPTTLQGFVYVVEDEAQLLDGVAFDAKLVGKLASGIAAHNGWSLELAE